MKKDTWLALQWKRLTDRAKKLWPPSAAQKSSALPGQLEVTTNIKWNHVSGQWARFHAEAQQQWGELTERELKEVNGHYEVLARKIQEKYQISRAEAKHQIDLWTSNLRV